MTGDPKETGKGHPLPASDEANHGRIPEQVEKEKGVGEDDPEPIQPAGKAVNPDGETYETGAGDDRND